MCASYTRRNVLNENITTYYPDGTRAISTVSLVDDGYITYGEDGRHSITYKDVIDFGYSTYYGDGTHSITYKNVLNDGYTTYHPDGTCSITYKSILYGGYVTYFMGDDRIDPKYRSSPGGWIGSAVDKLTRELLKANEVIKKQVDIIEQRCCTITVDINSVQMAFGDEENGRFLASKLHQTMRDMKNTESYLLATQKRIEEYILKIHE